MSSRNVLVLTFGGGGVGELVLGLGEDAGVPHGRGILDPDISWVGMWGGASC